MEAAGIKVTALTGWALLSLLLLQTSSVESNVRLQYFTAQSCHGVGGTCGALEEGRCCNFGGSRQSVLISSQGEHWYLYSSSTCSGGVANGVTSPCFSAATTQSGRWYTSRDTPTCESTALPDTVIYRIAGSGTWVLETGSDKFQDTLDQVESIPLHQKVAWLEVAGAYFKPELEQSQASIKEVVGSGGY